jgi:polysaccharide pyruvyl transferase WcaK-like protein
MASSRDQDPPRIVITHGYTDSNKGDVAIALATVAALHRAMPDALILSHSNFSEAHVSFHHHTRMMAREGIVVREGVLPSPYLDDAGSGRRRDLIALARLAWEGFCLAALWLLPRMRRIHPRKARALGDLRSASLVVARGGQYLHNESGRLRGMIYLGRMLLNLVVPIWLGRPTVVLGLSIGPLHGGFAHRLVTGALSRCRVVVVRENLSAELLRRQGLGATVRVAPDLGFLTTPTRTNASRVPEGDWIGVTLLNWTFPGHRRPRQALANYLEAVLQCLVEGHAAFSLVPLLVEQVTVSHHGLHDRSLQAEMVERLRSHRVPAELLSADLTPGELCDVFRQCRLVLASRLHTLILAACAGTPTVAIHYQGYKTRGVVQMLGASVPVLAIDGLTADSLLHGVEHVLAQRDRLSNELETRVADLRKQILVTVDQLAAIARPLEGAPRL